MPQVIDNFNLEAQEPLDARTKWSTKEAALAGIKTGQRTMAMFVLILNEGANGTWYSFQGGTANENFIPAPFEEIKRYYATLPVPDNVRDVQDLPIGKTIVIRTGDSSPAGGWMKVVPGLQFDRAVYPSLYATLNSDILPNITSAEGVVYIKAEQVSIARTDAMTPFNFVGGVYDAKIANVLSYLNTLIADLNFNEEMRKKILSEVLGLPCVPTESLTTMGAWLTTFKNTLSSLLNNKYVAAEQSEPLYTLIKKVGDIQASVEETNPGMNVQCRIGETVAQQESPGPGWIESNGEVLHCPETTGSPLTLFEYYDYFYDNQTNGLAPLALATPQMSSDIAPFGQVYLYKGDSKTLVTPSYPAWNLFNDGITYLNATNAQYNWNDPDPLYVEYSFIKDSAQAYINEKCRPRNIRRLDILFPTGSIASSTGYPTDFTVQGYDPVLGSWVDLMSQTGFVPTSVNTPYRFDFPNDTLVTSIRLKMTKGITGTAVSIYISHLNFYEYIPFKTPKVSSTDRKVWIKVKSAGNDLGLKSLSYTIGSNNINKGDLCYLDTYSAPTNHFYESGISFATGSNTYDVICKKHMDKNHYLIASSPRNVLANKTTNLYVIPEDKILKENPIVSPILKINSPSLDGGPCSFFRYNNKDYLMSCNCSIWEISDNLDDTFVRKYNKTGTAGVAENYSIKEMYHFDYNGQHYTYNVAPNYTPFVRLFRWDMDGFTNPVEVPFNPSLGLTGTISQHHFFVHQDKLYFICYDGTLVKIFRQDSFDKLTLLQTLSPKKLGESLSSVLFSTSRQCLIHNGKYVFIFHANSPSSYSPIRGSRANSESCPVCTYDFDTNAFEFPTDIRFSHGYKIEPGSSPITGSCLGKTLDEWWVLGASASTFQARIEMDRHALCLRESQQLALYPKYANTINVIDINDIYFIFSSGTTALRTVTKSRPRLFSEQDYARSSLLYGKTMIALESGIKDQSILCQEYTFAPASMTPSLVNTNGFDPTLANFYLPIRTS